MVVKYRVRGSELPHTAFPKRSVMSSYIPHVCCSYFNHFFIPDTKDEGDIDERVSTDLSAAPHGYSCDKNGYDNHQYCLCNKGERIVKFRSAHNNHHEDREWDLGCQPIPELTVRGEKWISITAGNGWDAAQEWNGVDSNSFLVGFTSDHNNHHEDRTYSFFTARSDNFILQQCSGWKLLNDWDQLVDLQLGDEEVIAGVKSVHNNHHEDRRFSVITCKIAIRNGKLCLFSS